MFSLPDLLYPPNALEPHIDTSTMEIHHSKHHAAYVKNLNDALPEKTDLDLPEILKNLNGFPESIRTKVRNNAGGHYNHSLFWQTMGPTGTKPTGKLAELITTVCGDLDTFKRNLTQVALDRFGSGWAWVVPQGNELFFTSTPNQDNPLMEGKTPILGLDIWEHAYYLKYQNRRADYVSAWWNVVNWTQVCLNFEKLSV